MNETDFLKLQARCVSHEIRNNVSVCEMYSEIIKRHLVKDGYVNKSVDEAVNCIQRSLKIIGNSLLDLKVMNSPTPQKFNLKEILLSGLEVSKIYLLGKDIDFKVSTDKSCVVYADENKFIACIVNLIKNAAEAIDEKGSVSVSLCVEDKFAKILFENTGNKIPDEKQSNLFDAGFTTKSFGSGLGLYICKNNLEMFDADLKLVKSDDISTVFEVSIPRADVR